MKLNSKKIQIMIISKDQHVDLQFIDVISALKRTDGVTDLECN